MIQSMGGWKFVFAHPELEDEFKNAERKICVAAHSTPYFDGIISYNALKYFGENNLLVYVCGPSPYFPEWCRRVDNNRGGFIRDECEELQNVPNFCRVIFPSGGTVEWKTGFYVLAQKLNAKIVILGIDYEKYSVVVDSIIQPRETFEETKNICLKKLRKYKAGPFCYILRVLFNYGCETYTYNIIQLYYCRGVCLLFILFFFYSVG